MRKSDSAEKIAQELLEQLKGRDLLFAEAMDVWRLYFLKKFSDGYKRYDIHGAYHIRL